MAGAAAVVAGGGGGRGGGLPPASGTPLTLATVLPLALMPSSSGPFSGPWVVVGCAPPSSNAVTDSSSPAASSAIVAGCSALMTTVAPPGIAITSAVPAASAARRASSTGSGSAAARPRPRALACADVDRAHEERDAVHRAGLGALGRRSVADVVAVGVEHGGVSGERHVLDPAHLADRHVVPERVRGADRALARGASGHGPVAALKAEHDLVGAAQEAHAADRRHAGAHHGADLAQAERLELPEAVDLAVRDECTVEDRARSAEALDEVRDAALAERRAVVEREPGVVVSLGYSQKPPVSVFASSRSSSSSSIAVSITPPSGVSMPIASGKTAFGEPQYGVPSVSTRRTRLRRASSCSAARMNRPPNECPTSTTSSSAWRRESSSSRASSMRASSLPSCSRGSRRQSQASTWTRPGASASSRWTAPP